MILKKLQRKKMAQKPHSFLFRAIQKLGFGIHLLESIYFFAIDNNYFLDVYIK